MKYIVGVAIFLLGLFILSPLLHPGLYVSHDGINHVARFASMYLAFLSGQFLPQWPAGYINHGFGSPLFILFYPLPRYLGALLHVTGLSYEDCFKVIMGASLIGMGISWYIWVKDLFKEKTLAVFSAISYAILPYHLLDVYVRGDIGEVLIFVFLPLVFWALQGKSLKRWVLGGIFYAFVLLSHNVMSLIFTPVFLMYVFLVSYSKKDVLQKYGLLGLGLGLAAFFWLPALLESKYVNTALFVGFMYSRNFLPISGIVLSPWGFGPEITKPGGLSAQLGIIYATSIGFFSIVFRRKCIKNRFFIFWSCMLLAALFFALPVSNIFWAHSSLLRQFQFPWRLMGLASFAACILIAYGMSYLKSMYRLLLIALIVVSIVPFVKVSGYTHYPDTYYTHFSGSTYFQGEATTMWLAGDPGSFASSPIASIAGGGKIRIVMHKPQEQQYLVDSKDRMRILVNTVYFPGWKVYIDGVKTSIEFQDMNYRGLITFYVPPGHHKVTVLFTDTPIRLIANILSLGSVLLVIIILVVYNRYKRKK